MTQEFITRSNEAKPTRSVGHFDRRENLEYLLEHHRPSTPEVATLEQYKGWNAARRREFDIVRSDRIAGSIVVETPALRQLAVEYRRASLVAGRAIGRTGLLLSGPPTAGKTTAAFQTMVYAFRRHQERFPDWKERGDVPVVYIELPPNCNGKSLMGRLLHFFGAPVLDRVTLEQRTAIVTDLLARSNTSLIVVDETQNILRASGQFEAAQSLKNLMNNVKAVPLYVGINLEGSAFTNDELGAQFASRCSLVTLNRINLRAKGAKPQWGGLIAAFERQYALLNHAEGVLLPHAAYLWSRTRGSISALSRLLSTAALDLIDAGDPDGETITKEQLDLIKLDLTTERELDLANDRTSPKENQNAA